MERALRNVERIVAAQISADYELMRRGHDETLKRVLRMIHPALETERINDQRKEQNEAMKALEAALAPVLKMVEEFEYTFPGDDALITALRIARNELKAHADVLLPKK
jgi:hypothetical protein